MPSFLDEAQVELPLVELIRGLGYDYVYGPSIAVAGDEPEQTAYDMERDWVVEIRRQCRAAGVPFFFKQWGGVNKKKTGRELDGRTYDEMPGGPTAEGAIAECPQRRAELIARGKRRSRAGSGLSGGLQSNSKNTGGPPVPQSMTGRNACPPDGVRPTRAGCPCHE